MSFTREDTKIMKAFAIFLMLYHHLFAFPDRINYAYKPLFYYSGMTSSYIIAIFGKLCVALFLFLGGYGVYKSIKTNKDLMKRILSLYKHFWKVFLIVVPISLILHVPRVDLHLSSFIHNFFALSLTYNGEWWFLTPYLLLIIFSPILIRFVNKVNNNILLFMFLIILNSFIYYVYPNIFSLKIFNSYSTTLLHGNFANMFSCLPPFLCGMIFAKTQLLDKIKSKFSGYYFIDIICCCILIILIFFRRHVINWDFIFAPIFIICVMIILCNSLFKYLRLVLVKIGEQSTNIWLTHSFFCYLWCQKFIYLPKYSILIFLLLLTVSYVFGLFIDLFYKLLDKLFLKYKKFLSFKHPTINCICDNFK